jgi:hypothetical protein
LDQRQQQSQISSRARCGFLGISNAILGRISEKIGDNGGIRIGQEDVYQALQKYGPCKALFLEGKLGVGHSGIGSCLRRLRDQGEVKMIEVKNPHGRGGRSVIWEAI